MHGATRFCKWGVVLKPCLAPVKPFVFAVGMTDRGSVIDAQRGMISIASYLGLVSKMLRRCTRTAVRVQWHSRQRPS
jgi:hypothetical protein